jgi:hypothetical protein
MSWDNIIPEMTETPIMTTLWSITPLTPSQKKTLLIHFPIKKIIKDLFLKISYLLIMKKIINKHLLDLKLFVNYLIKKKLLKNEKKKTNNK